MKGLLNVIALNVGYAPNTSVPDCQVTLVERPHILWILPLGVARVLTGARPLEILLAWILWFYPDRVEVEVIIVTLGEP